MSNTGIPQTKRFDQPLPINGRSIYTGIKDYVIDAISYPLVFGAQPTGLIYHGALVAGRVGVEISKTVEAIERGRIPSPDRFYQSGQSGKVTASLQEYQPEMVALAGTGLDTLDDADPTFVRVRIGGGLGPTRRLLITDDADVTSVDGFAYKQFIWTSPRVQGASANFSLAEEKAETVIPIEYNLNTVEYNNVPTLIEFRAYLN